MSKVYQDLDVRMEARWFPVLFVLSRGGRAAVTQVGERIGMTHPAVHQIASAMTDAGLLDSEVDGQDQRRRLLGLSPEGLDVARKLEPIWSSLEEVVEGLMAEAGGELMSTLERMEDSLETNDIYERTKSRLNP